MRRKIELYIGGRRADLNDQALVLFNYSQTDIQKPTAVKNAYSKQITLPGTPANDAIFSGSYRVDRTVGVGQFNPLERTAFVIYDERGTILEQGYAKLDKVTSKGESRTYAVTLYGGLGSFFYGLSYKSNGEKMTLADLQYIAGEDFDDELDFVLTAANLRANWASLQDSTVGPITFVPAYEGAPDGDFSADKAVASPASVGLPFPVTDGDTTYNPQNGSTIINLAEALDEWAAKDLRCYLQRPALKAEALLEAIADPYNNGGFTVDHSSIDDDLEDLWITLAPLTSLQGLADGDTTYELAFTGQSVTSGDTAARWDLPAGAVVGALTPEDLSFDVQIRSYFSDLDDPAHYLNIVYDDPAYPGQRKEWRQVTFFQVLAYTSNNVLVGSSNVYVSRKATENTYATETLAQLATFCGYTPPRSADYEEITAQWGEYVSGGYMYFPFIIDSAATGASYFVLKMKSYVVVDRYTPGQIALTYETRYGGDARPQIIWESSSQPDTYYTERASRTQATEDASTLTAHTQSQVRSGTTVKKADLLTTAKTPAEYLLSLAKTFGWCFLTDTETKKITILTRDDFFGLSPVLIDLTDRIDRSKGLDITPAYAGSKWYDLAYQDGDGAYYNKYLDRYGVRYGIQRVNTGYDFDSQPENIMDGNIFREAVSVLAYGPFWNIIYENGAYRPSVFVTSGHTYTLWAPDGSTKDFPVSRPASTSRVAYYNPSAPGYDQQGADKLELRDAEGGTVDGSDVLVWYRGVVSYEKVKVSDDSIAMVLLNEGKPCWDFNPQGASESVPVFSRFQITSGEIVRSLDFGDVRELAIPGVTLGEESSLYDCKWAAYLRDLLSKDTKILKCRVNLEGLDVGVGLLRRFFWYEGSLWVLNKINNYSLTTWDPAECEFVQVQEMADYNAGQIW